MTSLTDSFDGLLSLDLDLPLWLIEVEHLHRVVIGDHPLLSMEGSNLRLEVREVLNRLPYV